MASRLTLKCVNDAALSIPAFQRAPRLPRTAKLNAVGEIIEAGRKSLGLSVEGMARRLGMSRSTFYRLTHTEPPPIEEAEARQMLRQLREEAGERTAQRGALSRRLPPAAYAVVLEYLQRMERAGMSPDQIDEAERLMVDGAFNKINARDPRERSEEDVILDIRDAWDFVQKVAARDGVTL